MASCPSCQSPLESDFGLVTCTICGSVVFFDFDGNPQLSDHGESLDNAHPSASDPQEPLGEIQSTPMGDLETPEPTWDASSESGSHSNRESVDTNSKTTRDESEGDLTGRSVIRELQEHANSENSFLNFELTISGVDTKTLTDQVREDLLDEKLGLDAESWSKHLAKGQVTISNLNGVKMSILLKRLSRHAVGLSWRQLFSIAILIAFSQYGNSSEHGAEAPAAGHGGGDAPAAEAGGHGEAPAAAEGGEHGAPAKGPKMPEWADLQNRLAGIKAKIIAKQEQIQHLIAEKNHLKKSDPQLQTTIEELKKEHQELQKLSSDYEKEKTRYNYRFPEKGLKEHPQFKSVDVKPIQEMERDQGVDGHLSKTLKQLRTTYGDTRERIKNRPKSERKPASEDSNDDLDQEGVIIYRK